MPYVQPEKQRSIFGEKIDDLAEDIYFSMFQFQAKVYTDTVMRNIKKTLRSLMGSLSRAIQLLLEKNLLTCNVLCNLYSDSEIL